MPTIVSTDRADARRLATVLLRAAGDEPEKVRTLTSADTPAFYVPEDVWQRVLDNSFTETDGDETETETETGETETGDGDSDGGDTGESAAIEPPDGNASTAEWATFMESTYDKFDATGLKRHELIAEHDKRSAGDDAGE